MPANCSLKATLCLAMLVPFALASALGTSWTLGAVSGRDVLKWIVASCCALGVLLWVVLGSKQKAAPSVGARAVSVCFIVAATALTAAQPWIIFGPRAVATCYENTVLHPEIQHRWSAAHYLLDASGSFVLAAVAISSVAIPHAPSRYSRLAVLCLLAIWFMKLGWTTKDVIHWCLEPGKWNLEESVEAFSYAVMILGIFLANFLILLRIKALERSLGLSISGLLLCVLIVYACLLFVNAAMPSKGWQRQVSDWILVPFPLVCGFFTINAFAVPRRLLSAEARRVSGLPRVQAKWAADKLRCELGTALCVLTTSLIKLCTLPWNKGTGDRQAVLISVVSTMDDFGNALGVAFMSSLACWCGSQALKIAQPRSGIRSFASQTSSQNDDPCWAGKVEELAGRGFYLEALLDFYETLLRDAVMPSFVPERSTTNDVVRQAIIPFSRSSDPSGGGSALATIWNHRQHVYAQRMVTHNWTNKFLHLVAAIVADGLSSCDFFLEVVPELLEVEGIARLRERLRSCGALSTTYWVCAFSINQHASICGGFGPAPQPGTPHKEAWDLKRLDSVAGVEFSTCSCSERKYFSSEPFECELNKFDSMMAHLFERVPGFTHVVVVDEAFDVFSRAWCVAELVEASRSHIPQVIWIPSEESIDQHYDDLSLLDVRCCQASLPSDKELILSKIADVDAFNDHLQWLIFGADGLFRECVNAKDRAAILGRISRRVWRQRDEAERPAARMTRWF